MWFLIKTFLERAFVSSFTIEQAISTKLPTSQTMKGSLIYMRARTKKATLKGVRREVSLKN